MKTIRNIYNWFCIPALIIHEISHVLISWLTFNKVEKVITVCKKTFSSKYIFVWSKSIIPKVNSIFAIFAICLAPMIPILASFVGVLFCSKFAAVMLAYFILSFPISLPSRWDMMPLANYIKKKYEQDEALFEKEMNEFEQLLLLNTIEEEETEEESKIEKK
jgi:hypothetical protein